MRRISRIVAGLGAVAIVTVAVLAGGAAAPAVAAPAGALTWTTPSVTAEYGQYWYAEITYTADPTDIYFGGVCSTSYGCPATARLSGPVSFEFDIVFRTSSASATSATTSLSPLWAPGGPRTLPPGSYTLTVSYTPMMTVTDPAVSAPLAVTIVPAALAFTLTTQADPAAPAAIIVSALLARSVDNLYLPVTPGGTWTLTGVTDTGDEVISRELTFGTDDYVLWASTYWADPPPGQEITLTVSASGTASEYTITDGTASLATAEAPDVQPTPEPTPAPDEVAALTAAALPTWTLLVGGLVFLGALAMTIVIAIRRRRPAAHEDGVDGDEEETETETETATTVTAPAEPDVFDDEGSTR